MADTRSNDEKAKDVMRTKSWLASIRQPYEYMWDEIIDFVVHYRRSIKGGEEKGLKTGERVYDTTPLQALNLLADGLHGYLVSASTRWFNLRLPNSLSFPHTGKTRRWDGKRMDEMPEVRVWLEACEDVLYSAFLRSNFYEASPEYFRDGGSIGTANMYVEDDIRSGRVVFNVTHPREGYIAEYKNGSVSTFYREFEYTLAQMVEEFGYDKMVGIDPSFKQKYENNRYSNMLLTHAVYPRTDYDPRLLDVKNKPWASMWVLNNGEKLLRESGKSFFPHLTWRWRKNGDEWYGRSPSWDAYVEIVKNNQVERDLLEVQQLMTHTPYYMTEDLRGKVRIKPKGRTYLSASQYDRPPVPLATDMRGFPITIERQNRAQQVIRDFYHTDLFFLLSDAAKNKVPLTATQVIEISGERAAVIGTRIGRLHQEFLNPTIDIMFSIEMEAGRIPPPPQILLDAGGQALEVDYMGLLSQAQKRLYKTQGVFAGLEAAQKVGEMFPSALDIIDEDMTMKTVLEGMGYPAKAMRDMEKVTTIRQMRQKEMEEQKQMEMAATMADKIPKLGRPVEEGSIMEKVMSGVEGK